ncbi:MAG: RsbRD N-terminal domain-containing protein [Desulfovibrionales bacterium]
MNLFDFLEKKQDSILKKWFKQVMSGYAPDACAFFSRQKNEFANPVGTNARKQLELIYSELLKKQCSDELRTHVDGMVRMFAVQEIPPAQAVSFMYHLKDVVRKAVGDSFEEVPVAELLEYESRIDQVALLGFEVYIQCREKLWYLRANTIRDRTHRLLERANLIRDLDAEKGSDEEG